LCLLDRRLSSLEFALRLRQVLLRLLLLHFRRAKHLLCLLQSRLRGAVIWPCSGGSASGPRFRFRSRAGLGGFGMGEQGAETRWLGLAHKPGCEQVTRNLIVHSSGLERNSHRLAAKVHEFLECHPLRPRSRAEVAFACKLRVAQPGRSLEERFDLGAVAADKAVHGAGCCARLAQCLHLVCVFPLSSLAELTLGLVACRRELLRREGIQPIRDLVHEHLLIFTYLSHSRH
jgi:hypothetical protein